MQSQGSLNGFEGNKYKARAYIQGVGFLSDLFVKKKPTGFESKAEDFLNVYGAMKNLGLSVVSFLWANDKVQIMPDITASGYEVISKNDPYGMKRIVNPHFTRQLLFQELLVAQQNKISINEDGVSLKLHTATGIASPFYHDFSSGMSIWSKIPDNTSILNFSYLKSLRLNEELEAKGDLPESKFRRARIIRSLASRLANGNSTGIVYIADETSAHQSTVRKTVSGSDKFTGSQCCYIEKSEVLVKPSPLSHCNGCSFNTREGEGNPFDDELCPLKLSF